MKKKLFKASEEFVVGQNGIGWVDPFFTRNFSSISFSEGKLLPVTKLPRGMTGHKLLKAYPKVSSLGNVLSYMKTNKEYCLFLVQGVGEALVVSVRWRSRGEGWSVDTWSLGCGWIAGDRFASETTVPSVPFDSLEIRVKKLEEAMEKIRNI